MKRAASDVLLRGRHREHQASEADQRRRAAAQGVGPEGERYEGRGVQRVGLAGGEATLRTDQQAGAAGQGEIVALTAGPMFFGLIVATDDLGPVRGGLSLDGALQFLAIEPLDILVWVAPLLAMVGLYFILFIALSGRTPGQKLVGIRVINRAGGPPGPWRALLRLAGTALGLAPGGLGSLWMAFDREKRAFHDYLTGTYVVREN